MKTKLFPAIFSAACLCTLAPAALMSALAQTPASENTERGASEAATKEKLEREAKEKLEAAISLCDRGATAPVDMDGKASPVHFNEFGGGNYPGIAAVLEACGHARTNLPDEPRFRLQVARMVFINPDTRAHAMDEVRLLASAGKFDAMYMLYLDAKERNVSALRDPAAAREAIENLKSAANAGHASALFDLREELRFGYLTKVDLVGAMRTADVIANLPSQGPGGPWARQETVRSQGRYLAAAMRLEVVPNVNEADLKKALSDIADLRAQGLPLAAASYAQALRTGRGLAADPAAARKEFETELAKGNITVAAQLADMLAHGEGGPQDLPRAMQILEDPKYRQVPRHAAVSIKLFFGNKAMGRDPRRAIRNVDAFANEIPELIQMAGLLADYPERTSAWLSPRRLVYRLENASGYGVPEAGLALARLQTSGNSQFRDEANAVLVLQRLADDGNFDARVMLARLHFGNLDSSSQTSFNGRVYSEERIREILREGVERQHAGAMLLQGQLTRKGVFFAQDDRAATELILRAAQAGNVEAMISAAIAYDDGLGVAKNARERVRWLRAAAAQGSLDAKDRLGRAFTFDWKDRLLTLREGVSEPIVRWANSTSENPAGIAGLDTMSLSRVFSGGRSRDIPRRSLANAILDAFRIAPAGLAEQRLVAFARAVPDDMRMEIERVLAADGALKEQPDGFFGPAAREALRRWVTLKGPMPDGDEPQKSAALSPQPASPATAAGLPQDVLDRAREIAFRAANEATNARDQKRQAAALVMINALARYGDMPARWALMRNYHQSSLVRRAVTPAEVTRYALDILVTNPPQAEKASFEFIFNVTEMFKSRQAGTFANALIDTVRDDARLQDPVALAEIFKHTAFAPGGCDAISAALRQRKVARPGEDCSETTLDAVIAFAKQAGPSGIGAKLRTTAAGDIQKIASAAK